MKFYIYAWLLITAFLGYEFWALNQTAFPSLLIKIQQAGFISQDMKLNTVPGRALSLWLGWFGIGLMVLMNVYSFRKRFDFMQNLGKLSHWLNFHVFCGLMGPTLIFFHCGLKARGLVGISFWSMIISLLSGIIGRYFYIQLSGKKNDFENLSQKALERLNRNIEKLQVDPIKKEKVLKLSLLHVGANIHNQSSGPVATFFNTLEGDLRVILSQFKVPSNWPEKTKGILLTYAINKRKAQSLEPFEKLMGYWHTFHFPFAVFMYIAAIVHIISSLIFLTPN